MSSQHKFNSVNFLIYNIPASAPIILGFCLLPIYTAHLTPEDYGIRAMILLTMAFFQVFTDFGVNWVIRSKYYSFETESDKNAYLSTLLILSLFPRLLLCILLYFTTARFLPFFLHSWNSAYDELFRIQLLTFMVGFSQEVFFAIFIMERWSKKYSAVSLVKYLFMQMVSLVLLLHWEYGIYSIFYGELAGSLLLALVSFILLRKKIEISFTREAVVDVMRIGLPAIPKALFKKIQQNMSKYILQIYLPLSELGLFSKSEFLKTGFTATNQAFSNAFSPSYIKKMTTSRTDSTVGRVMIYWLFLMSGVLVFAILFTVDVFRMIRVDQAFWICAKYAPLMAFNVIIGGYALMYSNNVLVSKKTYLFTLLAVISGTTNIVANLLLIPWIGVPGAILATLLSASISMLSHYYFSERWLSFKTNMNLWIYFLILSFSFVLYMLVYLDVLVSVYAKSMIMIFYIVSLIIVDHLYLGGFLVKKLVVGLSMQGTRSSIHER